MKVELRIQNALPHQVGPLNDPARFKLWRWGRRAGKTRAAFIAGVVGHGAKPNGKGFLHGADILWVARDYTQAETVWYREIKARFANKPGFEINEQKKRVRMDGGGELRITSAENIDSDRGGNWDGVIIDEAAHLDLKHILLDVIRPGLADTKGWLIVMSTTHFGSHFNELCDKVESKDPAYKSWEASHLTAFDNPKMDPDEIREMIRDYDDPMKLDQEVYAKLTLEGGHAFPEWRHNVHVVDVEVPRDWVVVGALDWGYVNPGWFGYAGLGTDSEVYFRWEYNFREMQPFDVGANIASLIRAKGWVAPSFVVADSAMFRREHSAVTVASQVQDGLTSVFGETYTPALIESIKFPGSRVQAKVLVHQYLSFKTANPQGVPAPHEAPRLRFHSDCLTAVRTFPRLPRDPNDPEDVWTKCEDHAFDAVKGLIQHQRPLPSRQKGYVEEFGEDVMPGRHPGFGRDGARMPREALTRRQQRVNEALFPGTDEGMLAALGDPYALSPSPSIGYVLPVENL